MFAGQEKSSFDKDAGINSLNSGNFIFKAYQCRQSCIQFTNWFYLKVITGHEKSNVDGTAETFLLNLNFLAQKAEKTEQNRNFFSEIVFSRSVSWTPKNAIFTILLQWFFREMKFNRLKAKFDRQIVSFSGKLWFAKNSSEHG